MFTKFKLTEYLLLSIPLLLISGPFLPDLIVGIVSLYSIYLINYKKIVLTRNMKYFIFLFILFYFFSILSSYFSVEQYISLKSSVPYIRYLGFIIFVYFIISKNLKIVDNLGLIVLIISLIILIDFILLLLFGSNISGDQLEDQRFSSFFGDEEVLGSYLYRLAPLTFIYIFLIENKFKKKIILTSTIFLIGFLILLSGERTALFSYTLLLTILFIFFTEARKILLSLFVFFLISTLTLMIVFPNNFFSRPLERIVLHTMTQMYFQNQKFSFLSDRHLDHYKTAYNIFNSNLFLGGGNKSFRYLCGTKIYSVYEDIKNRNKEFSQYSDVIKIEGLEKWDDKSNANRVRRVDKLFYIKYKNNNSYHVNKIPKIKKLKDLFNETQYRSEKEFFYVKAVDEGTVEKIDGLKVNKGDFLFFNYASMEYKNGCNTHPHQIYLQIASENGIVNFLIICSLFFYIVISLSKIYFSKKRDTNEIISIFCLSMILIQILPVIPHGNFFNNWLSIFFFLPFGIYFANKRKI